MLYYWLHTLYIYFGSKLFWSKVSMFSDISRKRRVSILDCEGFRFMSNSKYFYYMDLIRFELLFRSDLYDLTVKKRIFPVLGSQKIIYRRPLKMWQTFKITLHLEGWDDKWVYHKQVFERHGEIYAIAYTKAAFWKNKASINLDEILVNYSKEFDKIEPSQEVLDFFGKDREILKSSNSEKSG